MATGAGVASLAGGLRGMAAVAGPFVARDVADHLVPADKKLRPEWLAALRARGEPTWYAGGDGATIGMPVGGIGAGQIYLTGDGRLAHWDLFNEFVNTGYGRTNYRAGRTPAFPIEQGFALRIRNGARNIDRRLDRTGFPRVRFLGEYPLARVEYVDETLPIELSLEAFSPFLPLRAEDSALPVTVLVFRLRNRSDSTVQARIAGWMQNAVCLRSRTERDGSLRHRVLEIGAGSDGGTMLVADAIPAPTVVNRRPPSRFADFEGSDWGDWTVEGEAFGEGPARGTLPNQQPVHGFEGKGLVNTYLGGNDRLHGRLTSPEFRIERPWITFLLGGGRHPGKTCVNLLVDGEAVRTATGRSEERLLPRSWNVREFAGKRARIEIVDAESGGWGHVNVDRIEFADEPRVEGSLEEQPDFGSTALAVLDARAGTFGVARAAVPADPLAALLDDRTEKTARERVVPFDEDLVGAVGRTINLAPGEAARVPFVLAWFFPNRPDHGHRYAHRFDGAASVVRHVAEGLPRLEGETRAWHRAFHEDSTLPRWLLDRLHSTVSTLATSTCQWWRNGRFWAYEGVGCCHGTCAHVWNYEHAMARLFPELERSVREMQDLDPKAGFDSDTGAIRFRGEGWSMWAGDAQAGTILKCWREHLVSTDESFLRRNWPRIRKALEFLIAEDRGGAKDGVADGILEGRQHNTYDIDFHGANTMIGSLYLAALRAGEEMARLAGEDAFADRCRALFESGRDLTMRRLFDGEYFVQDVDLAEHPEHQYKDGCLSDQLFGEGWARQVGLGRLYPEAAVRSALSAIWKYNWTPDVRLQNEAHPPERWFARPGEGGLFTCTWPKSRHLGPRSVRYRNEVWTGIEYQVAGHMAWEGMVDEALAICRAIHERYHPSKRNPYNEVECGDHYARAMASWGVYLALCGFEYDGPRGRLAFAPRLTPEKFRAAFTAAEGWGTIAQERDDRVQRNRIEVHSGSLRLESLDLEVPEGWRVTGAEADVSPDGPRLPVGVAQASRRVRLGITGGTILRAGESLLVALSS
jgi:uncharacterized protein (DUF608 family)